VLHAFYCRSRWPPRCCRSDPEQKPVALRKHVSPTFGGDRAACQAGPIRRGLLVRRFPLSGSGKQQKGDRL
jgi:hypothetical protein